MNKADSVPVDFHEADRRLRGHNPVFVVSAARTSVNCECGPLGARPYMWHITDVLFRDAKVGGA